MTTKELTTYRSALFMMIWCVISVYSNDPVDSSRNQNFEWKNSAKTPAILTTDYGRPVDSLTASRTCGPNGGFVFDAIWFDLLARFDRERIPERVVHAKGAGAKGYFEVTHNITQFTKAVLFSAIGKRTKIAVRFSQALGETGSPDTVRDLRGFAVKFYTEDGIFDLVGINSPVFFIRDAILFPSLIHAVKRNPRTDLPDANAFWDFFSLRPESVHQLMFLFSDRGIPDGYTHMNGFGSNTFKLVNIQGESVYCKFHYKTDQGVRNMDVDVANKLVSADPDYFIRDLYDTIHDGRHPSWTFYIQVMTPEQANQSLGIAFDATKMWPEDKFSLIEVGKLYLTENHDNYFDGVEQIAFSPGHMIPGIEPSPDKILQGRLFSYSDTHLHRLGTNNMQIPINRPADKVNNYNRDGGQNIFNGAGSVNYYPNSFGGPYPDPKSAQTPDQFSGQTRRYETGNDDNFSQPKMMWLNMTEPEKERMTDNIAENLKNANKTIQIRVINVFREVDAEMATKISVKLGI